MHRAGAAIALGAVVAVATGCTGGGGPTPAGTTSAGTTPAGTTPAHRVPSAHVSGVADCPSVTRSHVHVAIDFVDFVHAFGQQYVAGLASRPIPVARADLGEVALRSRCSFAAVNDRTHQDPGEARDGDTAFLAPGTPIYSVKGWSPLCRLAARSGAAGEQVAYLALDPDAKVATPRDCALHH